MTSNNFKCLMCLYETNRKYNFTRHMQTKHKIEQVNFVFKNVSNVFNNNINNNNNSNNNNNQCLKCSKILSSNKYLNKHLIICKGVSNILECHYCHKILANRSSKSNHIKTCKVKKQHDKNNNVNLIVYDKTNKKINFDISHLNRDIYDKIVSLLPDDAFYYYYSRLFDNDNNKFIIKTSIRNQYSIVHIGNNEWEKFFDDLIYNNIMYYISDSLLIFIENNSNIDDEKKLKKYKNYIDFMSDNGYSITEPKYWKETYKNNIKNLKMLFITFYTKNKNLYK